MRSGLGSSVRPKPGRLFRGSLWPSDGWSLFCPFDGDSEELSGVLGGFSSSASRASSSAIRARAACNWPTSGSSERISASFSAMVSLLRSISGGTPMLKRAAHDRVNHVRDQPSADPTRRRRYPGEQLRSDMSPGGFALVRNCQWGRFAEAKCAGQINHIIILPYGNIAIASHCHLTSLSAGDRILVPLHSGFDRLAPNRARSGKLG